MIEKTIVSEKDRLEFLPSHFAKGYLKYEILVYRFLDQFCETYSGGYWQFYRLSNGGIFISLDSQEPLHLVNPMNYFDDVMSAEAASICVNICALSALAFDSPDRDIGELYYALRDFAAEHQESEKIYRLID